MLRVFVEKHEKTQCPICKPMNLQRTFRCKNLPRAAALLQHRQVNLHARKIHVFLLANGDVIHDLAKERYHMLSLQTWIWTAKSEAFLEIQEPWGHLGTPFHYCFPHLSAVCCPDINIENFVLSNTYDKRDCRKYYVYAVFSGLGFKVFRA